MIIVLIHSILLQSLLELKIVDQEVKSYRIVLESIRVVKAAETGNDKELYGKVWAGAFCSGSNQQQGNSLDTREKSLVLFERTASHYVRVKEGQPLQINKALTFDFPQCPTNQANIALYINLKDVVEFPLETLGTLSGSDGSGAGCPLEIVRLYIGDIKVPLHREIFCYERGAVIKLTFLLDFAK